MKRFLLLVPALLAILATAHAQIPVTREVEVSETSKKIRIQFPEGYLDYYGEAIEGDRALKEKLFGLSFQRPPQTNGGWSLWNFLGVTLRVNGTPVQVIPNYLLESAEILENESRLLVRFRWSPDDFDATLNVFLAWYPEQPDWMFVKVEAQGGGVSLQQVTLNAFPGNTAGPEERERWVAAGDIVQRLSNQKLEIPASTTGFVFFNKLAQQRDGCLLVSDKNNHTGGVLVSGDYGVSTEVTFDGEPTSALFALGGFLEATPEDVVRVFQMEGTRNTQHILENISWEPKLDKQRNQILMQDIEQLLQVTADAAAREQFETLKASYQQNENAKNPTELLEVLSRLNELKQSLIARELAKLK